MPIDPLHNLHRINSGQYIEIATGAPHKILDALQVSLLSLESQAGKQIGKIVTEGPNLLLQFFQQRHVGLLLQDGFLLSLYAVLSGGIHGGKLEQEHSHNNQRKEEGCVIGIRRQIREQELARQTTSVRIPLARLRNMAAK